MSIEPVLIKFIQLSRGLLKSVVYICLKWTFPIYYVVAIQKALEPSMI